jgi:hypothetical protein
MRFTHELSYDAAPDRVREMLGDPAFRERVCEAMHASRHTVSVDGATVVVDQTQPARGIPSFAKRFVGDEIRIVQRETWSDAATASLTLEIPGKPGTFEGTLTLAAGAAGAAGDGAAGAAGAAGDGAAGTVESVTGEVRVRVPMVGGKLEGLVGDLFRTALQTEQRVGRAWLSGDR